MKTKKRILCHTCARAKEPMAHTWGRCGRNRVVHNPLYSEVTSCGAYVFQPPKKKSGLFGYEWIDITTVIAVVTIVVMFIWLTSVATTGMNKAADKAELKRNKRHQIELLEMEKKRLQLENELRELRGQE